MNFKCESRLLEFDTQGLYFTAYILYITSSIRNRPDDPCLCLFTVCHRLVVPVNIS